jgi:hypothetical protein
MYYHPGMENTQIYSVGQEAVMGKLRSHVPELLVKKGWDTKTFTAHCMLAGLSSDTAYRLAKGDTNFSTSTLSIVAGVLGVASISQVIDKDG